MYSRSSADVLLARSDSTSVTGNVCTSNPNLLQYTVHTITYCIKRQTKTYSINHSGRCQYRCRKQEIKLANDVESC